MWSIIISKNADKVLRKAPVEIRDAFDAWKNLIQLSGVSGVRNIKGYRDHTLKGEWEGARSSYLNIHWRVIYLVEQKKVKIFVLEITPHDYRRKL